MEGEKMVYSVEWFMKQLKERGLTGDILDGILWDMKHVENAPTKEICSIQQFMEDNNICKKPE